MKRSIPDIMKLSWPEQADHIRSLSKKELEAHWYQVQRFGESFDKYKLAVFSVLRDLYEKQDASQEHRERIL
jgi:hypothetical protein